MAITLTGGTQPAATYTEDGTAATVDSGITITDVASSNLSGATVTISTGYMADDQLTFADQSGITGNYANGILTLSGVASVAEYQTLLQSVAFSSSSQDPTTGGSDTGRTVSFSASDATPATSNTVADSFGVTAVNNPPTASLASSYAATVSQPLDLKGSLSVADPDGASGIESATLSVSDGVLTVTAGGTSAVIGGSGTSSVTITGTLADINGVLSTDPDSTVTYTDPNANPDVALTLSIDDEGNTGDPSLSGSASSTIAVTAQPATLPGPTLAFNPSVSVFGATVTLTGTVSAAAGVKGVELFEGTTDLGAATLNPDGTWSFAYHNGPGFHTELAAVATDQQGLQAEAPSSYDLTTGVTGQPFTVSQDSYDPTTSAYLGSTFFKRGGTVYLADSYTALPDGASTYSYGQGTFFANKGYSAFADTFDVDGNLEQHVESNKDGSHYIEIDANGQQATALGTDTLVDYADTTRFVFSQGVGTETLYGFQVAGTGHDAVSLPSTDAGRLGQILATAQGDGQGDTTIHFGQGDSVTFEGVTKAQLKAHRGDFTFTA